MRSISREYLWMNDITVRRPLAKFVTSLFIAVALCQASTSARPEEAPGPVKRDGTIVVPGFELPISSHTSPQARAAFVLGAISRTQIDNSTLQRYRETMDDHLFRPMTEKARQAYPVVVAEERIAGVRAFRVVPESGISGDHREKLLINLHGGGYRLGGGEGGLVEAIPIAATARMTVLTIDYRLGPEHVFPAASEDAVAVYRELLEQYRPENIGIYGCDAGGTLTAMTIAMLDRVKLPLPGAIGIFCAAATIERGGDSQTFAPIAMGQVPGAPPNPLTTSGGALKMIDEETGQPPRAYLSTAQASDPLAAPERFPELLAKFPPTLLIVGGRAPELSAVTLTKRRMTLAGVDADLNIWDGMWHTFLYDVELPESREAYSVAAAFFARHLGQHSARAQK